MGPRSSDQNIDRLYQLSPNDFTRERNALAKETGGEEGQRIKSLAKPSASAWAVNQLYWQDRPTYDALIAASGQLRAAHRAVLAGRSADLRAADATHRDAVNAAMASTLRLAKEAGQNVSSAMQMEIARTLQSLTADQPPGRLAKPLRPEGFEALQAIPIRAHKLRLVPKPSKPEKPSEPEKPSKPEKPSPADRRLAERQRREAERALKELDERERRDRATVARLEKQVAKAERQTTAAKAALDRAQHDEDRLRGDLQQAQEALERTANERRTRSQSV